MTYTFCPLEIQRASKKTERSLSLRRQEPVPYWMDDCRAVLTEHE